MAFEISSMVMDTSSILFLRSIWFCKQDPFIRHRFAVKATPQFENTRSEGVDLAQTLEMSTTTAGQFLN